jgi:hydrogenase nickel incorporation protein HypA/HybF
MHETGIAAEILAIAEHEARLRGARRIGAVRVRVGEMSGVVPEALEFAFEALKPGTLAWDARLEIEPVKVRARCGACRTVSEPGADLVLWCPQCGLPLTVEQGEELTVASIELDVEEESSWNESPLKPLS